MAGAPRTFKNLHGLVVHESNPYCDGGRQVYGTQLWDGGLSLAKFLSWREAAAARDGLSLSRHWAYGIPALLGTVCLLPLAPWRPCGVRRFSLAICTATSACGLLAGFALQRMARRSTVAGKRAIELGAGTGVTGLALGKLGALVTLTDFEPEVLALLRRNIEANDLQGRANVCLVDWAEPSTHCGSYGFNIVVAADVLYESAHGEILAKCLAAHLSKRQGSEAFFAYEHRPEAPLDVLFSSLRALGLSIERLEDCSGKALWGSMGRCEELFEGARFVRMPAEKAADAVRAAVRANDSMPQAAERMQIFRFTWPYWARCWF